MYNPMTSSMTTTTTITKEKICYMIGDSGYDDQKLYDLSINIFEAAIIQPQLVGA